MAKGLNLVEGNFRDDTSVADVIDALQGVSESRDLVKAIAICEERDGTLLIVNTDMTNTELIGTLTIAVNNYIHIIQHGD